jgi:cobalt-zinc-cadmium efflux system outer membrane protein
MWRRRNSWALSALLMAMLIAELQHVDAQRLDKGPPLTLRDAVDEAFANNLDLIALRRQLETTRLRPAQERFLSPPTLEAQIWQWPLNTLNPWNTNMYMFMVSQEFPGRGKRALRTAVAEKEVAIADIDVAVRARQVIDEVKQSYADLFIARQAIDVHLASVDLLRQFADVSQAKYSTGRISQQDVLKAVLELSRVHGDLITFQQQADLARVRLNVLVNRDPDAPIGPLTAGSETILNATLQDLQRLAIEQQPELRLAQVRVEQAEALLAVTKSDYKPDFSVTGGYLLMPNQTDAWLGRIGITWPRAPWSRGRIDARVAEATAAVETAKARQRSMEAMVRLAVQQAHVRVKAAEQRAALLRTTILPQSRQTLDVSRVGYQTDRVEFLALLDNERTLLEAQLEYFRAISDQQQALADLERALGADLSPGMTTPVGAGEVKP